MSRGKRYARKAATGARTGVTTTGVPVSKQELKVRRLMQACDKSYGSEPIDTFSFYGFAPVFDFDRRDGTLSVIDDFGLAKVVEKIDLGQCIAEWLDDQEVRDYAATYALRKGRLSCSVSSMRQMGLYDLRADVVKEQGETALAFYIRKNPDDPDNDTLIATRALDSLTGTDVLCLPGDWVIRPDDLPKLIRHAQQIAPFVGLPLPGFSPHWRKWDKSAPAGRTRSSLLAE
jgi:hypothetical protein